MAWIDLGAVFDPYSAAGLGCLGRLGIEQLRIEQRLVAQEAVPMRIVAIQVRAGREITVGLVYSFLFVRIVNRN